MPKRTDIKKVMVIGSGPIVIGQAAEFDYAGTQACLALKEEGYEVVLVNSNPATIMTDTHIADKVYMEPLTLEYVAKIIRYERPDAIVPGLGGQTGLNLAVQLAKKGILEECQVEILGTSFECIEQAEDRELFKELCQSLGEPVLPSDDCQHHRGGRRGGCPHRLSRGAASRLHAGRYGRRLCRQRAGAARDDAQCALPLAGASGAHREEHQGLQGDRVRGDARHERYGHRRLQHGEHRPGGHPYGRLDCGGAEPDAHQPRVPDAARQRAENHPRAENRGRLQRAVRTRPPLVQVLPHRGQPPCVAFVGPRLEGSRLSDCPRERQDRRGSDPRRDSAGQHPGQLRADARLRGDQDRPLPLRQVLRRLEQARHADEGHGRGDVGGPYGRGVACSRRSARSRRASATSTTRSSTRGRATGCWTISRTVRTTASTPSPSSSATASTWC